jgi:hypothetical protein
MECWLFNKRKGYPAWSEVPARKLSKTIQLHAIEMESGCEHFPKLKKGAPMEMCFVGSKKVVSKTV